MRKNSFDKSKKPSSANGKVSSERKSTRSKNQDAATRTRANGFAGRKTSAKNSTWKAELKKYPAMADQIQTAIDLVRAGKLADAARLLEKTDREFPEQAPILWYLGVCYRDMQKFTDAVAVYRRAVLLAPKNERVSLGLFHALWQSDQKDAALEEIKRFQMLTNWSCKDYLAIVAELAEESHETASIK